MTRHKIEHNAHVFALGQLVVGFQHLESELLRIVINCNMPGDQRAIAVLASQLSFRNLIGTLPALVDALSMDAELKQRTRDLAAQLEQINGTRNTFIHSHYHLAHWDINGEFLLQCKSRVNRKNGLEETEKWFNLEDITQLIENMGTQCKELHEIEWQLIKEGVIPTVDDEPYPSIE